MLRVGLQTVAALFLLSVAWVLVYRWVPPPATWLMLERRAHAPVGRGYTGIRPAPRYVSYRFSTLDEVAPSVPLAVVASEDQKFPEHWGFDVAAIEKAYSLNQHRHHARGASTISQQVAKNLFLWSGQSYVRKGLEAYFTLLIEACWPKRRILEVYLNIAQFGRGIYGAEAAAQRFFHEPAAALSRSQAAVLAAVLPNPVRFSAAAPSAYIEQRRTWILGQMQALGGPEMLEDIDAYPARHR